MSSLALTGYLSRSQVRKYLEFILENGAESIIEAPDGLYDDAPMAERIGSAISSVKQFHISRSIDDLPNLVQLGCSLVKNSETIDIPAEALVIGIFYMSKKNYDYVGAIDHLPGGDYSGDVGDVIWLPNNSIKTIGFSAPDSGDIYRLVVFWSEA